MAYISCLEIIEKSVKSVHHVPTEDFLYFKVITNKLIDLKGTFSNQILYKKRRHSSSKFERMDLC